MSFSCESADDDTRAFIDRMNQACRPAVGEVTIPFYAEQFGKTKLCGSAVLLQIAERHFVITTAHTFDARRIANVPIFVPSGVEGELLLPFDQVLLRYSETSVPYHRTDDPFDMCVCELPTPLAEQIGRGKRFLRLMDVDPWDRHDARSWYMVLGYPEVDNPTDEATRRVSGRAFAYRTFIYCDDRVDID